jgi:hypothetical protein
MFRKEKVGEFSCHFVQASDASLSRRWDRTPGGCPAAEQKLRPTQSRVVSAGHTFEGNIWGAAIALKALEIFVLSQVVWLIGFGNQDDEAGGWREVGSD